MKSHSIVLFEQTNYPTLAARLLVIADRQRPSFGQQREGDGVLLELLRARIREADVERVPHVSTQLEPTGQVPRPNGRIDDSEAAVDGLEQPALDGNLDAVGLGPRQVLR